MLYKEIIIGRAHLEWEEQLGGQGIQASEIECSEAMESERN